MADTSRDTLPFGAANEAFPDALPLPVVGQPAWKAKWAEWMGHPDPVIHKKASVLMLYWNPEFTDLEGISEEVQKLTEVFETKYNFDVVQRMLDTKTLPQQQAFKHLIEFVTEKDDENGLLIIYYAGHGHTEAASLGRITLSGLYTNDESDKKFDSIEWSNVEGVLSKTKSDVLEIFDCCHAGLLCSPAASRSFTRCFEILTACAHNQRTPAPGPHSFTTAMTWALNELVCKEGFSTTQLHAQIQMYNDFNQKQDPRLYCSRFEPSREFLQIAPIPKPGEQPAGPYRSQRNREVEQEQMLDLRFYYPGEITENDLKHLANALQKKVLHPKHIKAHRVSALGKYDLKTFKLTKENLARRAGTAWMDVTRRRSQGTKRPRTDTNATVSTEPDETLESTPQRPANTGTTPGLSASPDMLTPGPSEQGSSTKRPRRSSRH